MSKLADLIRRATRMEAAPMGFGSTSRKRPPTMLLVALVSERWEKTVAEATSAGADAILLSGQPSESDLKKSVSAADGRPCGSQGSEPGEKELARLSKAGIDFLVLDIQAPASALLTEELGILLHLKDELTDIQLRTIDALSLDAMYLEDNAAPLTIQGQMELQRVSGLARTPLLLKVRPDIEQEDLLSLREAGAILVAVDLSERNATDALRRLRGIVDALPPRRPRRKEMPEVTLPRNATSAEAEDDEEE